MALTRRFPKRPEKTAGCMWFGEAEKKPAKQETKSPWLLPALLTLVISLGFLYGAASIVELPGVPAAVPLFCVPAALCVAILLQSRRAALFGLSGAAVTAAFLLWIFWDEVTEGFYLFINAGIMMVNRRMGWRLSIYFIRTEVGGSAANTAAFLIAVMAAAIFLIGCAVRWKRPLLLLFVLAPPIVFGLCFYQAPNPWMLALQLAGLCGVAAGKFSDIRKTKRGRRKMRLKGGGPAVGLRAGGIAAVVAAVCFSAIVVAGPRSINDLTTLEPQRTALLQRFAQWFGETGGNAPVTLQGLGEGRLGTIGKLQYTGKTALSVTMQEPRATYLKGYVGSVYLHDRWEPLDQSIYEEYASMFSKQKDFLFTMHTTRGTIHRGAYQIPNWEVFETDANGRIIDNGVPGMTIEYVGANRNYIYYPYNLLTLRNPALLPDFTYDAEIRNSNGRSLVEYSTRYQFNLEGRRLLLNSPSCSTGRMQVFTNEHSMDDRIREYVSNSLYYEAFAERYYTQLPQNIKDFALEEWAGILEGIAQEKWDLSIVLNGLKEYYKNNTTYDPSPGLLPEGEDFVKYFLTQSRRGICTHYAASTTVLLRALGYPARYVEGYVVTQQDIAKGTWQQSGTESESRVMQIPDKNAHAWAEVFCGEYGWIPVDLTPGYETLSAVYPEREPIASSQPAASESLPPPSASEELSSSLPAPVSSSTPSLHPHSAGQQEGKAAFPFWAVYIGTAALAVLLVAVFFCLRRKVSVRRWRRLFSDGDCGKAVLALFDYWLRLLRFDGIKADDEALQELAAQVADAYGRPLAVCETHMRAVLQARFGQTPVSEEQRQAFQQEVSLLAGEIYQKQSRERKLLFKYWFALY